MASGILTVPAPYLPEVIKVIELGLTKMVVDYDMSYEDPVYINLTKWCEDMRVYLLMLKDKDNGQPIQ